MKKQDILPPGLPNLPNVVYQDTLSKCMSDLDDYEFKSAHIFLLHTSLSYKRTFSHVMK